MYTASCDFCKSDDVSRAVISNIGIAPEGWLVWKLLVRGRAINFDRLMCEGCQEERNIELKKVGSTTIADVILDEIADGIRDIAQDEVGER